MRHRVRRNLQAWAYIGAGRKVVDMVRNGVRIPVKDGPPAPFHQGVSMEDAPPDQLRFKDGELARFCLAERGRKAIARSRSPALSVPKPGVNKWRLIIDMRPLNRYC
eukprot:jgi/Tetstr1/434546/TSEL_023637.t1